jgi:ParB-like chromosome segregation protein Spo0J
MSPADLDGLVEDIKQNGLAHPIVRTSEGVVLDGRNRLKACEIAGIDPQFEIYEPLAQFRSGTQATMK